MPINPVTGALPSAPQMNFCYNVIMLACLDVPACFSQLYKPIDFEYHSVRSHMPDGPVVTVGTDQPWETVVVNAGALTEDLVAVAEAKEVTAEVVAEAVAEAGAERMRRRSGFPAPSWAAWFSR